VSRAPGLTELLTHDEIDLDDVVQTVPVPGPGGTEAAKLHIITAGAEAPNPFELMESQKLKALLTRLHERFDFIVVDAPPPSVVSDAIPLMIQVSGVLVVIRIRRTRRAALRRFAEQIHELGANALGLVINDVASGRAQGYGYGYGYGYEVRKPAASARGQSSVSRPMRPD
jgi:Mrp family chromosome partitioning ATPase